MIEIPYYLTEMNEESYGVAMRVLLADVRRVRLQDAIDCNRARLYEVATEHDVELNLGDLSDDRRLLRMIVEGVIRDHDGRMIVVADVIPPEVATGKFNKLDMPDRIPIAMKLCGSWYQWLVEEFDGFVLQDNEGKVQEYKQRLEMVGATYAKLMLGRS